MTQADYDAGLRTRREVLGDAYVDRQLAGASPFSADFQDILTRYAWHDTWGRPGLDRRTRSCITVMALIAQGHDDELAVHIRGAMRNGVTQEELREIVIHSAVYCGVPSALRAFRIANRVLEELEV